jgi:molybdopterin-binding protein
MRDVFEAGDIPADLRNGMSPSNGLRDCENRQITLKSIIRLIIGGDSDMKISARNQLKGRVKKIEKGAVNASVTVELAGGEEVVSIITMESLKNLGLKKGKKVYAVVKASSVMIAVD